MNQKVDTLNRIAEQIKSEFGKSEYRYMNSGACGLFAKMLSEMLTSNGFDVEYVAITSIGYKDTDKLEYMNSNMDSLIKLNKKNIYVDHLMLKIENGFMDSTGYYEDKNSIPRWSHAIMVEGIDQPILNGWLGEDAWNYGYKLFNDNKEEIEKRMLKSIKEGKKSGIIQTKIYRKLKKILAD